MKHLTFIIPVRIDCEERKENLNTLVDFLLRWTPCRILILEADKMPLYSPVPDLHVQYFFIEDTDPVFYRTRYLNRMLQMVTTSVVGVWDTDVFAPISQIEQAYSKILEEEVVLAYPYDGHFYAIPESGSHSFRRNPDIQLLYEFEVPACLFYTDYSVGGAFLVNRDRYWSIGGENEHFYGWGPEDMERHKRMEIMEYPVFRSPGPLFHLFHPRGDNSIFFNREREIANRLELLRICAMDKSGLRKYITTWPWTGNSGQ